MIGNTTVDNLNLKSMKVSENTTPVKETYIYKFEIMNVSPAAEYVIVISNSIEDDQERKHTVIKTIKAFIKKIIEQEENGRKFIPDEQIKTNVFDFIRENYKLECYLDSDEFVTCIKEGIFN